jgi:DNA-binding response OmpR family regulator
MHTTILLAKEPDLIREGLAEALTKAHYRVILAANSNEALQLLKQHHIDLILADLQLPSTACLTLLREARGLDPLIGFICLKGYSDEEMVREALRRQADDFLLPPYDRHELYFRVTACLAKQALRRTAQAEKKLPVCAGCRKANPKGASGKGGDAWVDLETLLADQASITLTHGLCPECAHRFPT